MGSRPEPEAGVDRLRVAIGYLRSAIRKAERGDLAGARGANADAIEQIQKASDAFHETLREFLERNRKELESMGLLDQENAGRRAKLKGTKGG